MPIAAWVVTLDAGRRDEALAALSADARLTLGEGRPGGGGERLPVVVETATLAEGESVFEAVSATPGVVFVDVVGVDFSDAALDGWAPEEQTTRRDRNDTKGDTCRGQA